MFENLPNVNWLQSLSLPPGLLEQARAAAPAPQPSLAIEAPTPIAPARPVVSDIQTPTSIAPRGGVVDPRDAAAATMAAKTAKTGMVVDPYRPETSSLAVTPPAPTPAPKVAHPTDPNFTVATQANPDFGVYGRSAGEYAAPQLQPANDKFKTPYYAAYTNDNDLAGAVMAGPGQGIRLVDAKSGEVVFQGTGPEAAQQAVGIANAVSEDRGRKAAWKIEADYGPEKGWVAQAAERYDPKKQGFFGKLADIALPILGAIVAGPLGAAAGSAASGVAQGRSLKNVALGAALSGAGAFVAPGIGKAVSGALAPAASAGAQAATQGALQSGTQAAVQAGTGAVADGAGTLLSELVVQGSRGLIPAAVAGGLGAGVGSVGAGALQGGSGGDTLQPSTASPPTDVSELVVQGVKKGLSVQQLVAMGIPLATINSVMASMGAGPEVDEFVAEGPGKQPDLAVPVPLSPSPPTTVDELVVTAPPKDVPGLGVTLPAAVAGGGLLGAIKGAPQSAIDKIKADPLNAAGIGLLLGSALLGNKGAGKGAYGIPNNGAGTRESLSPIFSGSLPAPGAGFGVRTPRTVNVDQRYAIEHPEASFFNSVPEATGPRDFAVQTPEEALMSGIPDLNHDGTVNELDLAVWRKRFGGQGYRDGGRVSGPGGGRDDQIDAKLSNNEYVIDAETVALLGDGSPEAGAHKLDSFRVKLRREKGRDLARGRFSRAAREPHEYMGDR